MMVVKVVMIQGEDGWWGCCRYGDSYGDVSTVAIVEG